MVGTEAVYIGDIFGAFIKDRKELVVREKTVIPFNPYVLGSAMIIIGVWALKMMCLHAGL